MMNAIIFGANGQDGYYLSELCKFKGINPICTSRTGKFITCDVSNYKQVLDLIKNHQPSYIFHLAAKSTTSHTALFENHETISTGTLNILEAVKRHCPDVKVFITGSGVQFKNSGQPISENDEFEASSVYSVARIQSVYAARYFRSLGIRAYVGYLFHHESPLRKPNHISKIISLAVKRISKGSNETIELGDISVEKEWTFAGDTAEAIFTLVNQDQMFEAVIGSGIYYSIKDWIEQCFSLIGKDWHNYIHLREDFKPEYKRLVSNPSTIVNLGWSPRVNFKELSVMMCGVVSG
jgi:GDPmannose 4,6-dehydratase